MCGNIIVLYNIKSILKGSIFSILLIIPIAREILFEMLFIWESHLVFLLRFMPRKLKVSTI